MVRDGARIAIRDSAKGLLFSVPVLLAGGLDQHGRHVLQRVRVLLIEPLGKTQFQGILHIDPLDLVPDVVVDRLRFGHLPAEQVGGGLRDLNRSGEPLVLLLLDPARVPVLAP